MAAMPTARDDDRRRSRSPTSRPRRENGSSRDAGDRGHDRYRDRDRDRDRDTDSQSRDRRRQDGEPSSSRSHKHRSSRRQRSTSRTGRRDRRSRGDSHSRQTKRSARPTAATMMGPIDDDDDEEDGEQAGERILPYDARTLSRGDYGVFRPLFAHYLDLHAQINIHDLGERELRHRWRSFVRRWNAGKLSEGWYEPEMFQRVARMWAEENAGGGGGDEGDDDDDDYDRPAVSGDDQGRGASPAVIPGRRAAAASAGTEGTSRVLKATSSDDDDDDDDDDYGPPPPPPEGAAASTSRRMWPASSIRQGPGIPSMQDLSERRAAEEEARQAERRAAAQVRRADRAEQKERLDELAAPTRADPGTRERRLEKRRELNDKLRGFRERSPGAADVGDGELMGGGDGADDYRRELASLKRKKTERELRREEEARARAAELQKRLQNYQAREDRVVGALRELAKQRFG